MSNFLNVSVLVLATMVLVLAGMVGYLYWQQNKLMRAVSSLSGFVSSQFIPPVVEHESEHEHEHEAEHEAEPDSDSDESDSEDDRVSVEHITQEESVQIPEVSAEPPTDVDDFQSKTMPQLRELLNKKGIPFGKRDSKSVLLELLKASS